MNKYGVLSHNDLGISFKMNDTADIVERFQSPLRKNTIFTNLLYRVRLVPINTGAVLSWSMPYESVGHSIPVRKNPEIELSAMCSAPE
ncbi:hypothetical protein AFLA_004381 [Aspergillus flavus NRRL3357]|nr:hypothetical protein AFLA_004381 [Aspergillus flavus NRRL3357]